MASLIRIDLLIAGLLFKYAKFEQLLVDYFTRIRLQIQGVIMYFVDIAALR